MKILFERYYLRSTESFLTVFKTGILVFSARFTISAIKFAKHRESRLQDIRVNLAVLTITQAIRTGKINIKAGVQYYHRLNKKRKQLLTVKTDAPSESIPASSSKPDIFALMKDLQNQSFSSIDEKVESKSMTLSKLAYNIKENKDLNLAPLLERKYVLTKDYKFTTPVEIDKFRSLTIGTPPMLTQKRLFSNGIYPTRLMCYPVNNQIRFKRPLSSHSQKVSEDMNFLKPTEFFIRKISVPAPEIVKSNHSRPPSKKLMKHTASSKAKQTEKKDKKVKKFEKRKTNTIFQTAKDNSTFSQNFSNWKSFDSTNTVNVVRKEFLL